MRTLNLTIILIFLCALSSFAQGTYSIKGTTTDTVAKAKLTATVTVMDAKDSILLKFTHAAADGSFAINGLPAGNLLLLVTYPDYADYVEGFTIDPASKVHNFGNISMGLKSRILQEVIIKGSVSAIKIKGDTTEFNAKAYVIQPNSKVEDLLKQMPGMEVDKDGKISFQGEQINKVLVDGEEFFGDDPKLVTRNIRGDMVDKVQVYDKKSDQAAFTGIDDGVKIKTLNVKLKEDKKNGTFGKIDAGIGTGEYNEVQALYNRFKNKEKISAYATTANDGKMGLGFQDASKLGTSGSNVQISDDGGITIYGVSDDIENGIGTYYGTGLPLSRTSGVHYDNKWNNDKESINTNYKIGSLTVNTDQTTLMQRVLGTDISNTESISNTHNYTFRQRVDAIYQKTFSPESSIKFDIKAIDKSTNSTSTGTNTVEDGNGALLNKTIGNHKSDGTQKTLNADIFYTKKFKKVGRTFSWDVNETYNKSNTTNYQYNDVYTTVTAKDTITDQYKPTTSISSVLNSNMTYSEPITKSLAITFNYGLGLNNSTADRESFNKSASGQYDIFDPVYSSNYKFNILTNQFGAVFNYRFGKSILTFGTKISAVDFRQTDQYTDSLYKRNFVNWLPQLTYQYRASQSKSLNFTYNGNTIQPSLGQIQPLRSNADPTNILIGNPNLTPSFSNRFSLRYSASQALTNQYFSANGSVGFTTNTIINNSTYDASTGKQVSKYVNLADKTPYNYNFYLNASKKLQAWDMGVNASLSTYAYVNYYYTNNILNTNTTQTYSASIGINKNKASKYSFYVSGGPSYNFVQPNNNSAGFSAYGSATVWLPLKFILSSDVRDNYTGKTATLPAFNKAMWNASFGKTFLKENNLKFSIAANNILDQNQNNRYSTTTGTIQNSYNSIPRYFMFTVAWDFTKFGTTTAKN